jgi:hypothetical protein
LDSVIGKKYQVRFRDDLTAGWLNIGLPMTATGLSLSTTDNFIAASQQRFSGVDFAVRVGTAVAE